MPEFNLGNAVQAFSGPLERANALQGFLQQQRQAPGMFAGIKLVTEQGPEGTIHKAELDDDTLKSLMKEVMGDRQKLKTITEAFDQQLAQQQQQRQARMEGMSPLAEILTTVASSMGQAHNMPGWVQGLAQASAKLNPTRRELEGEVTQLGQERARVAQQALAEGDRAFGMAAKISEMKESREARIAQQKYQSDQTNLYHQQLADARRDEVDRKERERKEKHAEGWVQTARERTKPFTDEEIAMIRKDPDLTDVDRARIMASSQGRMNALHEAAEEKRRTNHLMQMDIQARQIAINDARDKARMQRQQFHDAARIYGEQLKADSPSSLENFAHALAKTKGKLREERDHAIRALDATSILGTPMTPAQKQKEIDRIHAEFKAADKELDDLLKSKTDRMKTMGKTRDGSSVVGTFHAYYQTFLDEDLRQRTFGDTAAKPAAPVDDTGVPAGTFTMDPKKAREMAEKLAGTPTGN